MLCCPGALIPFLLFLTAAGTLAVVPYFLDDPGVLLPLPTPPLLFFLPFNGISSLFLLILSPKKSIQAV